MDERRVVRSLDILPVKEIGNILSHMGSARHVAMASTTSSKWRDAAASHLWRLTFDISDFPKLSRSQEDCEMIMTEAIMRRTSLRELSIGAMDNVQIHGAPLIAWLSHTKKTLKSLTLIARVTTQVDILRKLAGKDGVLEHLVWRPTYIPVLNPAMHNLPFLVSLTLDSVLEGMSCNKLRVLLSIFPKLEFLCLSALSIENAPSEFELYISPSLKTLKMEMICFKTSNWMPFTSTNIVLHAHNLERLSLSNVESEGFVAFDIRQISGLKDLVIQNVNITWLELRDNLQRLVITDAQFPHVEIGSLPSLHYLKLSKTGDLMPMWPTYSQIIVNASSKLRTFQLLGGLPAFAALDVEMIWSSFPY